MRDIPSRVTWLMGLLAVSLLLMAFQLYRLTIVQSTVWRSQAEQNMLRELPSYGPRGTITDWKGRPLATSEPAFAAVLVDQDPTHVDKFLPALAILLAEGDEQRAQEIIASVRKRVARNEQEFLQFEPLVVERNLSQTVVSRFMERRNEFPGVEMVTDSTRSYPEKSLAGALMGFVGPITEEMLKDPEFAEYHADELVGKDGIERFWEKELRGKPGSKSLIVDQLGKPVGDFKDTPPEPGHNLTLSLDLDMQRVAEQALAKQMDYIRKNDTRSKPTRAALVAIDVRTGAILTMASYPTYDPNIMVRGISQAQWDALQNQPGSPLVNWTIQGFAPGSTYKMATGLAGLQLGKVGPFERIPCPAGITYGGRFWWNWTHYDQGYLDIANALAQSCNPFFWEVGQRVGIDELARFNAQWGFGKPTGIDLWGESAGVLPTKAEYGDRWDGGQTLNVSIGQGDVLVTPLQLAVYTATIANAGVRYQPYLVQEVRDANGQVLMHREPVVAGTVQASPENWKRILDGMYLGSHNVYGTAYLPFEGFPISTGAKTGSAETTSGVPDALSVAYAPFDKPEIAVSIIIQGGETGSWTTPVIRRVMAQYFGIHDVIPGDVPTYRD